MRRFANLADVKDMERNINRAISKAFRPLPKAGQE